MHVPDEQQYHPNEDRPLSEAILDAIEAHENTALTADDVVLYDAIDPAAVDRLFREDPEANPNVKVEFEVDDVIVRLWGNGGVAISVSDRYGGA